MSEEEAEYVALLPCPFCGSHNLRVDMMLFDDEGERDAVECLECDAMNSAEMWNRRAEA